jgi:threonine aldolase
VTSQQHKSFASDNQAGAHPRVLSAMMAANSGDAISYGADPISQRVIGRLREQFGAADALIVLGGTAANVVGISLMVRPFEAVICAESAHVNEDECGATERVLGTKLLSVPTPDGKLTPDLIARRLSGRGTSRRVQPRAVVITQATEFGTCYSLDELREIGEFCRTQDLLLYIDGARLANAAAHLNCSLADLGACADVLSFGATKNGAVCTEAVIVMNPALTASARFNQIQLLQLPSKMRFLAAQLDALLTDELWRQNAGQANAMARRLAAAVRDVPGVRLAYPVEANAVFAAIGKDQAAALAQDWNFGIWTDVSDQETLVRWMTAFDTAEADIDEFAAAIRATATARV